MKLTTAALVLTLATAHATEYDLPNAQVTVPYSELKALLLAAQPTTDPSPPKPPVAAVLTSADYHLTPTADHTRIEATYALRTLTSGWQLIPLLGGSALLESSSITPGEDLQIVNRAGTYHLLANQPGTFEVALVLSAPSPGSPEWPRGTGIVLAPSTATINRLTIDHVASLPVLKPSRAAVLTHASDQLTTYHLPSDTAPITIEVGPVERLDGEPPTPSSWTLDSQLIVNFQATRLDYTVRTFASTTAGDATSLSFSLPVNATSVSVGEAEGLRWHTDRSTPDAATVHLDWDGRGILDREFSLTYQIPQSPLAGTWQLAAPAPADDGTARNLFTIVKVDGLDLASPDLQPALASRRLPDWMHRSLAGAEFATIESDTSPAVTVNWLPRVQPAEATVRTADFATQVAADGTLLTTATYVINHESPLAWKVTLPADNQLLACTAGDKPIAPISRPNSPGVLELPLPSPSESSTTITLSYTEKLDPLDPLSGRLSVAAPHTATFIHQIDWALTLPDTYTSAGIEGNLRTTKSDSPQTLKLTRKLCRGDLPTARLHYTTQR